MSCNFPSLSKPGLPDFGLPKPKKPSLNLDINFSVGDFDISLTKPGLPDFGIPKPKKPSLNLDIEFKVGDFTISLSKPGLPEFAAPPKPEKPSLSFPNAEPPCPFS